jgi:hypothetical protein
MMNKRIILLLLAVAVLLLVLTQTVSAMSSDNYTLDWYTPLASGGGGKSSSTNYTIELSIGQSAIGSAASTNYRVGLGYWGALIELVRSWYINLPLIMR